jgi:hypothetical protein
MYTTVLQDSMHIKTFNFACIVRSLIVWCIGIKTV